MKANVDALERLDLTAEEKVKIRYANDRDCFCWLGATAKRCGPLMAARLERQYGVPSLCTNLPSTLELLMSMSEQVVGSCNLKSLADFSGTYAAASAGVAVAGGASGTAMKNDRGVVIRMASTAEGIQVKLAIEGVAIELENQAD